MNVVQLSGRLTRDPEVRFVGDARFPITSLNIAVDDGEGRFNRQSKKSEYDSGFYQVEVVGEYGRAVANALKRGAHVYVVGSLSQWVMQPRGEGKESVTKTRIRATMVQALTGDAFGQLGTGIEPPDDPLIDPSWTSAPPPEF